MIPYDAATVTKLLRAMPDARLARARPEQFQTWPAQVVIPGQALSEIITNEAARRRRVS